MIRNPVTNRINGRLTVFAPTPRRFTHDELVSFRRTTDAFRALESRPGVPYGWSVAG